MSKIMGIDPGSRSVAWAIVDTEKGLIDCGYEVDKDFISALYAFEKAASLAVTADHLVIEIPQVYLQRSWKGDPNDLINVAVMAGACAALETAHGLPQLIQPHKWKGSVKKEIMVKRILKGLDASERAVFEQKTAGIAKSLRHNTVDAIGIAKWRVQYVKGK